MEQCSLDFGDETFEVCVAVALRLLAAQGVAGKPASLQLFKQRLSSSLLLRHSHFTADADSLLAVAVVVAHPLAGSMFPSASWTAVERRLQEEVGLSTPLAHVGTYAMDDETVTKFIDVYLTHSDHATIEDASVEQLWYW